MFTRTNSAQIALVDALDEFDKCHKAYISKRKSFGAYLKQLNDNGVDVVGLLGMYVRVPGPLLSMAMPMLQSDATKEAVKLRKAITRVERAAEPFVSKFRGFIEDGYDFQDAISAAEVDSTLQIKLECFPAQVEEFEELDAKPVLDSKVMGLITQFASMRRNPRNANEHPNANEAGQRSAGTPVLEPHSGTDG